MADDRKHTYQSVTSLPKLRPSIGVPPLKMVLVGGEDDAAGGSSEPTAQDSDAPGQVSKERVVRKIIAHLKKDA